MTGLRPPPTEEAPSRVLVRILVLVVLVVAAGLTVWAAVIQQRIELTEDTPLEDLELEPIITANGTSLNVVREGEGAIPLVLLHDIDVAGSVTWDGVVSALDQGFTVMRVDLPGFGLSERIPFEGTEHTVASMAVQVGDVIEQTFEIPVVIAGVGLGGEVAAEIAVMSPELVSGVVLVDVDFYKPDGWVEFVEKLPWFGIAATFAFETAGSFSVDRWAPHCLDGGWCPTRGQAEARDLAETIVGTTDSIRAFRRTPAASLVPSKLSEITVPLHFLWSQQGEVPRESVDRVLAALPEARVDVLADAWKAHLEFPLDVAAAIAAMAP
jgi:pimeloyl-ACP methyl ester carboxylesterase